MRERDNGGKFLVVIKPRECRQCGKTFKPVYEAKFCNNKCYGKWSRRRAKKVEYLRRVDKRTGYILVRDTALGRDRLEHRKIMEQHIGRKLERTEVVHHINEIR